MQLLLCLPDDGVGVLGPGTVARDVHTVDSFLSLSVDVYKTQVYSLGPPEVHHNLLNKINMDVIKPSIGCIE